jgi:hypothetical protein
MRGFLLALFLLLSAVPGVMAQPGPPQRPGPVGRAYDQSAPNVFRQNLEVWAPGAVSNTSSSGAFSLASGKPFIDTVTVPGDATNIWLVFANGTTSTWGIQQAVVATSASWVCDGAATPGVSACDGNSTVYPAFLPVTFKNSGTFTAAYPPPYFNSATNVQATCNGCIIPLVLASGQTAGNSTLSITSATASNLMGATTVVSGKFISDGALIGCIPASTTATLSGTTLTLSNPVQAPGCTTGQTIWASDTALGTQAITVPAAAVSPSYKLVFSDPIEVQTPPRSDGPILAGEKVFTTSCAGGGTIPANTTISSVLNQSATLSNSITGTCNKGVAIQIGTTTATTADAVANSDIVKVASTQYLSPGMVVSGDAGITGGTIVTQVCSGTAPCSNSTYGASYVRISPAPAATVSSGATLTFSVTAKPGANVVDSAFFPFFDTTPDRIITVRGSASGSVYGFAAPIFFNTYIQNAEATYLGMPTYASWQCNTAVDCLNFPALATNVSGSVASTLTMPLWAVVAQTRSRGLVILDFGTSHMSGFTSISDTANAVRRAAYALSSPTRPVTAINGAMGGQTPNIWLPIAQQWLTALKPMLVIGEDSQVNGADSTQSYAGRLDAISSNVLSYGGQFIHQTDQPRTATTIGNIPVAAAFSGTSVPLLTSVKAMASGSTVAITALSPNQSCVPAGTTAVMPSNATMTITLSQSATCPAGTVLTAGVIGATTTSGSTTVTLSTVAPMTGTWAVSGANITGVNCIIGTTISSTAATLGSAGCATGTGATTLTLGGTAAFNSTLYGNANIMQAAGTLAAGSLVFDTYQLLEDPNNRGKFLPAYSSDSVHGNDYAHSTMSTALQSLLKRMLIEP